MFLILINSTLHSFTTKYFKHSYFKDCDEFNENKCAWCSIGSQILSQIEILTVGDVDFTVFLAAYCNRLKFGLPIITQ